MKDLFLGVCSARSILDGTAPMRQYKKTSVKKGVSKTCSSFVSLDMSRGCNILCGVVAGY